MQDGCYHIGICDDELYWQKQISTLCELLCAKHNISMKLTLYSSGEDLLGKNPPLDILFLDEEMGGISGCMVKEIFENHNKETMIIFITSHDEIIYDSFGKNVYGFLSKPIKTEDFKKIFERIIKKLVAQQYICTYDSSQGQIRILCRNILYIEADGSYVKITYEDGKCTVMRKCLADIENENSYKYLVRIHKSYMVNIQQKCILNMRLGKIQMENGQEFPIARRRRKMVEELYSHKVSEAAEMIWNI